jgi:hypothetical protein
MRAHNVLCNSYNSRDKPLQLSSCTFCVVLYAYRLYFINVWHVYEWPKTYTWSGTFILKDGRYTFYFFIYRSIQFFFSFQLQKYSSFATASNTVMNLHIKRDLKQGMRFTDLGFLWSVSNRPCFRVAHFTVLVMSHALIHNYVSVGTRINGGFKNQIRPEKLIAC